MKSLQPINDNVALKLKEDNVEKTASGLYIPDTAQEKPQIGEVIAIATDAQAQLAVGDLVIFKKYSGVETKLGDQAYILVPVGDILAKIVEVDAIPN